MPALYTTDLSNINLVTVAGSTTNWTALGGGSSGLVVETDFYIQGDACMSKAGWSAGVKGMIYNNAAGVTFTTNEALFMWLYMWAPNALSTEAAGGLQVLIGNTAAAYRQWYVRGSDTYQYGGWVCVPVDPTITPNASAGTPTTTYQYFGAQANITGAVTKGQPLGIDAFRKGRTLTITSGDTSAYGTFTSAASTNDLVANRWGLFQSIDGGYIHQGLLQFGTSGSTVDFRDSNRNISIVDTKKVQSGFNGYEINKTGSRVDWNTINITALGTTSKGYFKMNDICTVNITDCSFTKMSTFIFKSGATITNTTFRECDQITQSGATFTGCKITNSTASVNLLANNLDIITNTTFTSDGTGHAIEIRTTGSTGTYTLSNVQFTSYASGVSGTTGNEAIYNNSGGAITINITGGGNTPSYRNGTGASTVIQNSTSLTISGLIDGSEVRIYRTSDSAELYGVENITGGQTIYSYNTGGGTPVYIMIINNQYEHLRVNYTLPTTNTTLPVQQKYDRWYNNP